MMNYTPGFYWCYQHEKSQKPTIVRLKKSSGWEYFASEHSTKMIANRPYKIIKKVDKLDD